MTGNGKVWTQGPARWRRNARVLRAAAEEVASPRVRDSLLKLADEWERMAVRVQFLRLQPLLQDD